MGKDFISLNYYEMLDIKPDASPFEIRHAYNTMLQMYRTESLISYSFFTPEERAEILSILEKAYLTLINDEKRQAYDDELIHLGILDAAVRERQVKKPISIFDINREQSASGLIKNGEPELKAKVAESKLFGELLSRPEISGSDLRAVRNELAVTLEHISQKTKIRIDNLRSIEEDKIDALPAAVFLKGFLKAYLKCLCLEPADDICIRYMNRLVRSGEKP